MSTPILSLANVSKRFVKPLDASERIANLLGAHREPQIVRAVDRVDLTIMPGEVVGLVGESGCGKSTLGRIVAGIQDPSEGVVAFKGQDIARMNKAERRQANLAVQMVFQDPMGSLNPRMKVLDIVGEAPVVHGIIPTQQKERYVSDLLGRVGLDASAMRRYPHQFSGGQRARIGIARALAVNPTMLVCDEATAALDVSIQAQIINLFVELREEFGLTYLFVSHDLGVVAHVADRVAVMYLGRIVELGSTEAMFASPNHPYTQALLSEVPQLEPKKRKFSALNSEIPSPLRPPPGCSFHTRCPHAFARCETDRPAMQEVGPGRLSACHLNDR
ncbi:ATP-binding cassette domain-containing protein [Pararhizobium sp. YC-54]|uniref:ABC transporter ATP-binding protein n=1 Tax=Pararhizobium sp. YC-54 TaxID=2986920 RepID=UPI0021F75816|nr:oligopeptide/dipeptide ABC transporter ATP-binding protein [Pararhizobium sp. YC-54]MCW0002172.1 ATP-binding cassette domain-containing protein [Pararhizobium sp. YC-54]